VCANQKKKTKLITILNCLQNFALNVAKRQVGVLMSRVRRRRGGDGRNGVMETEIRARHWPSSSSSHRRRHHYRHWQRDEHHNYGNWAARGFVKGVSGQSKKRLTKMATNLPMAVYVYICVCVRRLSLVFVF